MSMNTVLKPPVWWLEPLPASAGESQDAASGLSAAEARLRLASCGPNLFREQSEKSLLRQYLSRFKNPLVLILLVASAVSALTGEVTNFVIISCIVLLSVTLDFVQEHRANAAAK
ncbi:MAG: cation-transporting P-type ATPase, partial [Azonexus sp.]